MSRETRNTKSVEGRTRLSNVFIKALIAVALIVADGSAIAIRFASAAPTPAHMTAAAAETSGVTAANLKAIVAHVCYNVITPPSVRGSACGQFALVGRWAK
jgi:hypothetical protein